MTDESPDYTLAIESAGPSARGGFEFRMRPGIDLAKHLTQSVRSVLDGHGAENYVEMRFDDGEGNEYVATFRRRGGKTPDELRREAVDELAFERARLAEVQGAIHRLHYPIGDPATEGNVWCACCKSWPCETVTAVSVASTTPTTAEEKP